MVERDDEIKVLGEINLELQSGTHKVIEKLSQEKVRQEVALKSLNKRLNMIMKSSLREAKPGKNSPDDFYGFMHDTDDNASISGKSYVEKEALINVLKSHKRAIAWKISDIKACEEYVQEVLGFSDNSKSGNPTLISDPIIALYSPSLTPFEGGDFVLEEIEACLTSESIPPGIDDTDLDLEGDIRLLKELLNNDPSLSPLPPKELNVEEIKTVKSSIDEPLELELKDLPSHLEYAYLEGTDKLPVIIAKDGFFGYFQIPIDPQDQEKTTFTCPYRTFAYQRMPFGLFNAPRTFQRCMMVIFHDMIEKIMEVFMDDFLIFGDSFSSCLSHLDTMLRWCKDTNLVLNWEKCHFMVKEGIVLGHKISKNGLEIDRAKVDVIAKLPIGCTPYKIALDLEASRAHGFAHHPLELQSLIYGNLYPRSY
nr:reverse transcriptase domain-containing protein [Tanacetum cinerariifolium]